MLLMDRCEPRVQDCDFLGEPSEFNSIESSCIPGRFDVGSCATPRHLLRDSVLLFSRDTGCSALCFFGSMTDGPGLRGAGQLGSAAALRIPVRSSGAIRVCSLACLGSAKMRTDAAISNQYFNGSLSLLQTCWWCYSHCLRGVSRRDSSFRGSYQYHWYR